MRCILGKQRYFDVLLEPQPYGVMRRAFDHFPGIHGNASGVVGSKDLNRQIS
jgi:hypothetical protein